MAEHPIHLSNGASRLLTLYLNSRIDGRGHQNTPADVFYIGSLLASHLSAFMKAPKDLDGKSEEEINKWADEKAPEFPMPENQRDAVKRTLESCARVGQLQPDKYTVELLTVFGLSPS